MRCLLAFFAMFLSINCFSVEQCTLQIGSQASSLYVFGSVKLAEISSTYIWFDQEVGNIVPADPQQVSPTSFNYNSLYRLTDQFGSAWYFRFSGEWFDSLNTHRTAFYSVQWAWGRWPANPGRYVIETIYSPRTQNGSYRFTTIGDSMTWFSDAQSVRCLFSSYLPNYAFIGSRTDSFGYGHDGHGGDNTGEIIARLSVVPVSDVYMLLAGANDVEYTPNETAQNIGIIVDKLLEKNSNAKIYVSTLPPRGDQYSAMTIQRNSAIRSWYSESGKENNVMLIDTDMAMRAIPGALSRFISNDHIHPNPEGYDFIAKLISAAVRTQFAVTAM
ncbi:SGNH/GDSL hydrolase family protein [Pseudomonas brassicacearum]|uniref:SGNH/GDSL hydrolase family protein n=1 Tax=Pseudomonas brassicacearum TaxID=930166 RepID=UPI00161838BE|nr:SGNH/GDSL hydrolase family protein [Pseudomonas brassicacearum]